MRLPAVVFLSLVAAFAQGQQSVGNPAKLYAVIFDATVDSSGLVDKLKVEKVIDPSSGTTNAVNIAVPDSYLRAARTLLRQRNYGTDSRHFNTWLFFDPNRPERADIDPKSGRP